MFKEYLKGIDGIVTYPLFSLVIFFCFFLVMTIWVIRADKSHLKMMSKLPLDDQESNA